MWVAGGSDLLHSFLSQLERKVVLSLGVKKHMFYDNTLEKKAEHTYATTRKESHSVS